MPLNGGARTTGVRLTDIDIKLRRRYGRIVLERAIKELNPYTLVEFAAELRLAVEEPSDRVYWLSAEAVEKVLG
jgi:signal recognition particle subunit SEC65